MAGRNGRLILISVAGLAALFLVTLVAAQSTSTATVEVRVWRNVEDPERLHLSTRPADGRWVTHNTRLDMSERSDSGLWHQSSIVAVDVEVPATAVGPEPSALFGIDDSQRCADLVAFIAEHFAETVSVTSCEKHVIGERNYVRGVVVHHGQNAAFTGVWSEADGLRSLGWIHMYTHPIYPSHCFDATRRIPETHAPIAWWNCMTRIFVENMDGDAGDPAVVWELIGATTDATGEQSGFKAHYLDAASEPRTLEVYGAQPSRFHGVDGTPECVAVVAFVVEHFAATTSITSCEGQAKGAGSLRGLLVHRDEPSYFDGIWSETDGITRLNWAPAVTWPVEPAQCKPVRDWLVEYHASRGSGVCSSAEATVTFGDAGPTVGWVTRGKLSDATGQGDDWFFEAWVNDGAAEPWFVKVYESIPESESPPAE